MLKKLGIVIDFGTGQAMCKQLGLTFQLDALPSGHLYVDLYRPLHRKNPAAFVQAMKAPGADGAFAAAALGDVPPPVGEPAVS